MRSLDYLNGTEFKTDQQELRKTPTEAVKVHGNANMITIDAPHPITSDRTRDASKYRLY